VARNRNALPPTPVTNLSARQAIDLPKDYPQFVLMKEYFALPRRKKKPKTKIEELTQN
jgi:hypothetical protein